MEKIKIAAKYLLYSIIGLFALATSLFLTLKSDITAVQEVSKTLASIAVVLGGLLYVRQPPSEIKEDHEDKNFRIAYLIITSGIMFAVTYILSSITQLYPSYSMISAKAVLFMATWLFLISSAEFSLHNMEKLKILNEKFQGL
jgi:hypothetical protein